MPPVERYEPKRPAQLERRERAHLDIFPWDEIVEAMAQKRLGKRTRLAIRQIANAITPARVIEPVAKARAEVSRTPVCMVDSVEATVWWRGRQGQAD